MTTPPPGQDPYHDPYQQLPKIFEGIDTEKLEFTFMNGDELADGGAAMTAYSRM